MCQAIKSSKAGHPSPPPDQRQQPSILGWRPLQCQTKSPFTKIKRGTPSPLLYRGDCWLPSTTSTAAELTAVLDGPPYHLSSQSICVPGLLTRRRVTTPLPHEVAQEEPDRICLVASDSQCFDLWGQGERQVFSKSQSQWDALSTAGIFKVSPSFPGRWSKMLVNSRQPSCTCSRTVAN